MIKLIKTIIKVVGRRGRTLVPPIIASCVDALLQMGMFSMMILAIIDLVQDSFTYQKLLTYSLVLLGIFLVRAILNAINYTQTQYRGADITAHLRLSLGDHIRSLNLGYFNTNSIGRLTSTLTTDIGDFEQVLTHSLTDFFKVLFFSMLAFVFAFTLHWRCALIILVVVAAAFPLMSIGGRVAKSRGGKQRAAVNGVISRVVEYINGIKTFKLYNLTGEKFERLDDSFKKLKRESIFLELSIAPFSILFSFFTSLIIPVALVAASLMMEGGGMTDQNFVAVIMVAISISNMMTTLGTLYPEMKYLSKAAENILDVRAEASLPYQEETANFSSCDICFDDVYFRYTEDVEVLHGIHFEVKPGTTTALIGPSGSGKTTIVSLISRFWDVTKGKITIGGKDIRTIAPDGLTSQMSVVFQDVYLLHDTIANNIRVGKPDASEEEVIAAAQAAQCHAFISALPDGYDTLVGEGGSTLSGGEKQRVSIARALIKDAPIVLLDETTSNLDADNEWEINRALDVLMRNKTVIVIAHRLNTIMDADTILVLNDGAIVEQGNHQQLLSQDGWYARMIAEQEKARKWVV